MVGFPHDGETLLGSSAVYLFGRLMADIIVRRDGVYDKLNVPKAGKNLFLRSQFEEKQEPYLARIFSFSFEGSFYELSRPAIYLVHGTGLDPDWPTPTDDTGKIENERLARSPGSSARTGLGWQSGSFARGIKVWVYDKGDFSLRLDVETGQLEDILLAAELVGDPTMSSSKARSSGGMARSSGARSSGVLARSSGWISRKLGDAD